MNSMKMGWCVGVLTALLCSTSSDAVSPEMVRQGRMLFEHEWSPTNPKIGSDGLGPLFNGKSCVACHNQGGVGGAGEAKFNAKSIGIDKMHIAPGPVPADVVLASARGFHPGLIDQNGVLVNTVALSHHGGTTEFDRMRQGLMKNSLAEFGEEGGPVSAAEVRYANATPLLYSAEHGKHRVTIRARMYQRNTTALFGSGLIDRVTGNQLVEMVRIQERNPEIHGRIGTKEDGRFGRFGWRANVANLLDFCDQACAAEMGLETKRKRQPLDPTDRNYRNQSVDIADNQIRMMAAFVASLPAPQRIIPDDTAERELVLQGEKLFASVGCAACHVPSVGPAKGLYSDLLLHDMGFQSLDLNPADPYIYKTEPVSKITWREKSEYQIFPASGSRIMASGYYGGTITMPLFSSFKSTKYRSNEYVAPSTQYQRRPSRRLFVPPVDYVFKTPIRTQNGFKTIPQGKVTVSATFSTTTTDESEDIDLVDSRGRPLRVMGATSEKRSIRVKERADFLAIHSKGTNVAQEWRTPPLWGVRDSAPYMHDGRAETLLEAITMHEGEGTPTRDRFLNHSLPDRHAILAFLNTLVAPQNLPQPAS